MSWKGVSERVITLFHRHPSIISLRDRFASSNQRVRGIIIFAPNIIRYAHMFGTVTDGYAILTGI